MIYSDMRDCVVSGLGSAFDEHPFFYPMAPDAFGEWLGLSDSTIAREKPIITR
jgi:hypothetical protein